MVFSLQCRCGELTEVRSSSAGATVKCSSCGQALSVPSKSTLQDYADRGEPVPEAMTMVSSFPGLADQGEIPEAIFAHYCGKVGFDGYVSASAIENYVGVLIGIVDRFLKELPDSLEFEIMISCALMPQSKQLLEIETTPSHVLGDSVHQLQSDLELSPFPPIVDGPIAFVVYRRVNVGTVANIELRPFGNLKDTIEELGLERALMESAGLSSAEESDEPIRPSLWRRLFSMMGTSRKKPEPQKVETEEERYKRMNKWLSQVDEYFADSSIDELKRHVNFRHDDMACLVALADHYARSNDWSSALECYTDAISIDPSFAALFGRRATVHMAVRNRQNALSDWSTAIELAPFDPWFHYHRSKIYADLEAWSEAIKDLEVARSIAPREPVFVLTRSKIQASIGEFDSSVDGLLEALRIDPNSGPAHATLGIIYRQESGYDLEVAIEHLSKAIELMPDDLASRIHRSLAYATQNKFELALLDCDDIIRLQPDLGMGYGLRGRVLQMRGDFEDAIESCDKAIELGLEAPIVYVSRGFARAATGQLELALTDCDEALALDDKDPLALQLRGMLCLQQGELESAMESFLEAKEIAPEWNEPREQLALVHRMNENPEAAVEEQTKLIEQQPKHPAHYVNRAFAYTQLGEYEQALKDYDRAKELDPLNEEILYLRGCFFMDRQQAEEALGEFDRVLELASDHDDARLRRASMLLRLKRQDEALADYQLLIDKHPDNPHAYTGRAYANQLMGNEEAANLDLNQLDELAPEMSEENQIQALCGKVARLGDEEQYDEAIRTAEEVIDLAPDKSIGYQLRGYIRWYSEQYVEAYDDYTQALEMDPDDPAILNARGQVQAEMGEYRSALDDLDFAIDKSREAGQSKLLAYALSGRALALGGLGRIEESTQDYQESIKHCPTNAWAYYNRGLVMYQNDNRDEIGKLFKRALELDSPSLPKRKRERAKAMLDRMEAD